MKKLTLRLDDLQVDTFTTAANRGASLGTVRAREDSEFTDASCYDAGCNSAASNCAGCSNYDTCWGCDASADGGTLCDGGGGGTIGVHCGPQGTMNPAWGTCVVNTQAGATCDGSPTCGSLATACC